ncbi:MAG: hypothetical protein K2K34_06780 [Oscillospiraceae bacterium]|nr:hypothetical protein [Oscillospiraceae bacterium]
MNNLNETVKVRDLLIYFGITLAISAFIKKISKREDGSVFLHALSLTMGWLCGKMITNYIDEKEAE